MYSRFSTILLSACAAVLLFSVYAGAQGVYSYVDERGVRILTNIPPKNPEVLKNARSYAGANKADPDNSASPAKSETNTNALSVPGSRASAKAAPAATKASVDAIIDKYAGEFKLDPSLVRSMIWQESGFNSKAVSRKGAQGLMQLMPSTAAKIGVHNSFDPEDNIRGGMKHLRGLMDMFGGDLELSLAAYNAGENLVQRIGRIPDIRETHDYIRGITRRYGSRKMSEIKQEPSVPVQQMFRFTDASGVLHLTNIPPVPRETDSGAASAGDSQSER